MEMDRPHTQKKKQINCKAGPNMEPTRQEKEGRSRATWRRTTEQEMKTKGLTWQQLDRKAQDRRGWRGFIKLQTK